MLSGEPTIYAKTAESGAKSAQAFCPRCGSPIYAARFGDAPKFYTMATTEHARALGDLPGFKAYAGAAGQNKAS
jgi:hypothetical protein